MIHDLATHPHPYVTVTELADYLSVARRTVSYWIEKGAVAAVVVGHSRRIPIAEARACVKPVRIADSVPTRATQAIHTT